MGRRNWKIVPLRNRLGNFVWRTTFNILYGTKLKDTNNSQKIAKLNRIAVYNNSIVKMVIQIWH